MTIALYEHISDFPFRVVSAWQPIVKPSRDVRNWHHIITGVDSDSDFKLESRNYNAPRLDEKQVWLRHGYWEARQKHLLSTISKHFYQK